MIIKKLNIFWIYFLIREALTSEGRGEKLETFYFVFGKSEVYAFCNLSNNAKAVALFMAIIASEAGKTSTIVLMTVKGANATVNMTVDYPLQGQQTRKQASVAWLPVE